MAGRDPHEPDAVAALSATDRRQCDRSEDPPHQDRDRGADFAPGASFRLAEETATIDQISGGRLIFGVGRSAFPRAYNAYGISYEESQDRFAESLDIIKTAWTQPVASYRGRYHSFDNITLVPRPLQQPHPEIRIAASQHDTYATIGELGYPLFSAVRASPLTELAYHTKAYREAWAVVGHHDEPRAFLQVPIYVAETRAAALEDAREGMMRSRPIALT